jgi:hypothetical protein
MMNPDEGGWTDWFISLLQRPQLQKKSFVFPLSFLYCVDAIYAHGKAPGVSPRCTNQFTEKLELWRDRARHVCMDSYGNCV